jgi:hypothetical protein
VQGWAAHGLQSQGDPRAAPGLTAALKDRYEKVRCAATEALRKLAAKRWAGVRTL